MDFNEINTLFSVLAHCRDLPQYRRIKDAAAARLHDWEDGILGNESGPDKPEPPAETEPGTEFNPNAPRQPAPNPSRRV